MRYFCAFFETYPAQQLVLEKGDFGSGWTLKDKVLKYMYLNTLQNLGVKVN